MLTRRGHIGMELGLEAYRRHWRPGPRTRSLCRTRTSLVGAAAGGHSNGGNMLLRLAGSNYSVGVLQSASERNRVKEPSGLR